MAALPVPHPHQADLIGRVRIAYRSHNRVLMQLPTGGGKTFMASLIAKLAESKGGTVWFICHRREILTASMRAFDKVGVAFGVVAAGFTGNRHARVQICSIGSLAKRLDIMPAPTLIVWDECQHMAAASWGSLMAMFPDAKHLGLSATPERLDGAGLGAYFDAIVNGPAMRWLIENGFLSPYRLFAPSMPDLKGVHTQMGDYNRKELAEAVTKPAIIGDVVKHYERLAPGSRAVGFAVSIKHSLAVVERFQAAGIRAAHVDGTTDNVLRDKAVADLESGAINVLMNVDVFTEGFDLPVIDTVLLLRPTKSVSMYLQMVGRGLRVADGKAETIILDHGGLALTHGLPDDDREWTLAGRKKKKRGKSDDEPALAVRQCPTCFSVHRPAPHCPRCGHEYATLGRTVEELEGELTEVVRAQQKQAAKVEVAQAKNREELVRIGRLRGYKSPEFWAQSVLAGRAQRDARL